MFGKPTPKIVSLLSALYKAYLQSGVLVLFEPERSCFGIAPGPCVVCSNLFESLILANPCMTKFICIRTTCIPAPQFRSSLSAAEENLRSITLGALQRSNCQHPPLSFGK
jgi:hypothetical protein